MIYLAFEDIDLKHVEIFGKNEWGPKLRILSTHPYTLNNVTYYGVLCDHEAFKILPDELSSLSRKVYQYDVYNTDSVLAEDIKILILSLGILWATNNPELIEKLMDFIRVAEYDTGITLEEIFKMSEQTLNEVTEINFADIPDIFEKESELLEDVLTEAAEEFAVILNAQLDNTPYQDISYTHVEDISYEWALHLATYLNFYASGDENMEEMYQNLEIQMSSGLYMGLEDMLEFVTSNPKEYLKVVNYPDFFKEV